MNDTEIISKLNELLSYAEIYSSTISPDDSKRCVVHFSRYVEEIKDMVTFRIIDEHSSLYRELFWSIFNKGNIKDNYALKTFSNKLHVFMFELKIKSAVIDERNFGRFFNRLNTSPKEHVEVFHQIYGLDIMDKEPIKIGCFTLYNYKLHKNKILAVTGLQTEEELLELYSEFRNHNIWISTNVQTVDVDKAYEIACKRFEILQGISQFIFDVEGFNAHAVCILTDVQPSHNRCYAISESRMKDIGESDIRRIRNINIINLIHDSHHLFVPLVEKIFISEKSEILNRIRNAFTTYGRILYERTDVQKFTMYVTTIEALVEYNTSDLTELISKYVSAMISNNYSSYLSTKADFRIVYNQRSEISHGSRTAILNGDLVYAKAYAVEVIRKFVTDKEIFTFTKNKELKEHLESKVKRLEVEKG